MMCPYRGMYYRVISRGRVYNDFPNKWNIMTRLTPTPALCAQVLYEVLGLHEDTDIERWRGSGTNISTNNPHGGAWARYGYAGIGDTYGLSKGWVFDLNFAVVKGVDK